MALYLDPKNFFLETVWGKTRYNLYEYKVSQSVLIGVILTKKQHSVVFTLTLSGLDHCFFWFSCATAASIIANVYENNNNGGGSMTIGIKIVMIVVMAELEHLIPKCQISTVLMELGA